MTNNPWQFVERVIVRKVGRGFIGEARGGPGFFDHSEICDDPASAMDGAARALDATLRPKMERKRQPFGDLL